MALVEILLSPLPAHVRTARLVGIAAARRAGLEAELVDELRLALGEACSRAVGLHAQHAPEVPVRVTVDDRPGALIVTVTDAGPAAGPAPDDLSADMLDDEETLGPDVALAVLTGLLDAVEITPTATGTTITMHWPLPVGAAPGGTALSTT